MPPDSKASGRTFSQLFRCITATVFLALAAGKLLDFPATWRSIYALGWLSSKGSLIAAALLLVCELVAGMLLMLEKGARLGSRLGIFLCGVFALVTSILVFKGASSSCDCFGIIV